MIAKVSEVVGKWGLNNSIVLVFVLVIMVMAVIVVGLVVTVSFDIAEFVLCAIPGVRMQLRPGRHAVLYFGIRTPLSFADRKY